MHYVPGQDADNSRQQRGQRRVRAVAVALICTGVVAVVEIVIGLVFRLQSILSEGIHTLADMADSAVAYWAVRRSAVPPDTDHPFGHGKFESVAALVEGLVITLTGVWICYSSLANLIRGELNPNLDPFAIGAMGIAAVFYFIVSQWLMRRWRETHSPAVHAEAVHLRTHVFITAGLFGGLLAARFARWMWMDAVMALFVGLLLLRSAMQVFGPAWGQITDAALPKRDLEEVTAILRTFSSEYVEIHRVRSRASGAEWHLDFHLVLKPDTTVHAAHHLCDRMEDAVEVKYPDTALTIHVEPAGQPSTSQVKGDRIYFGSGE